MSGLSQSETSGTQGGVMDDPYTMEFRLCDDNGNVTDTPVEPGAPGTILDPDLTYLKLHNNLRARNRNPDTRKPIAEGGWQCTGHAHLGGEHIRCTSPVHSNPFPAIDTALRSGMTFVVGSDTFISPEAVVLTMTPEEADRLRSALNYAHSVMEYHGPLTDISKRARETLMWASGRLPVRGTA